jgi:hypothetical protein
MSGRIFIIAALVLCLFSYDSRAALGDEDAAGKLLGATVVALTVPASVVFIIVNVAQFHSDDPSMKLAAFGLGFGLAATGLGVAAIGKADSDERGPAITVTAIGATCSVFSAINMYRASRTEHTPETTFRWEPAVWIDSHHQTVFGAHIQKSF